MTGVTVAAPAKVNLLLRVLAREESGYHRIESLFQALDLHDTVDVAQRPEPGVSLEVTWAGPFAGDDGGSRDLGAVEENLAYRAAVAYRRRAGLEDGPGVALRLTKVIPAGAGLGGGSSDAAAVLRALDRIHGGVLEEAALMEVAGSLGSDVPFFLGPSPLALGWGRGERLLGLPPLETRPVLVVVPPFRVSTAEAYRRLAGMRSGSDPNRSADAVPLTLGALSSWPGVIHRAGNDFEAVVLPGRPGARKILELLASGGGAPALLSGSGSALFGVFPDEDVAASTAERIRSAVPGAGVVRTATLDAWPEISTS